MKVSYILASTIHGTLIVNRNDENQNDKYGIYGVGWNILETGAFYKNDIDLLVAILKLKKSLMNGKRKIVAIDCGANIGVHTVEFARALEGAGEVISIEAQRPVYYALCGNIAINNCLNVEAKNAAIGDTNGTLKIPNVDYHKKSSFGSLELIEGKGNEDIGQCVDYNSGYDVPLITIDSLNCSEIDLVKIDVEGMEMSVLKGASKTLNSSRPVMFVEKIKSDFDEMLMYLASKKYRIHDLGDNIIAVSDEDSASSEIWKIIQNFGRY
ncbi:methyltransferase FkbM [Burkholderia sp. TSV86]|nr:methyltransferase FkbM [Burkholderia sp. TSV86]